MFPKTTVAAILLAWACASCNSAGTIRSEPLGRGATRTFAHPYSQVLEATRQSVPAVGLELKSDDVSGDGNMIIAQKNMSMSSYGQLVRILVLPDGARGTAVRIFTQMAYMGSNAGKLDLDSDLFTRIGQKLGDNP